ncbi:hypothetical protein ACGFX4_17805 [Kitasatospora sp. NPDC048365]|uniref:hypothetical protein n=1 Tax=Kitasatospora sp. NPDC048365 TaxID=3364050 RepID=UPI00371E07CC
MDALGVVVALAAAFGLTLLILAVIVTVKAVKAVADGVHKQEVKARRAVENATLKAKSFAKPGDPGKLAAVRLELRTALDSTRQVLQAGHVEDSQLGESLQLLARLDTHAAELDTELRLLEREPDAARVSAKLPELRERADRITHSADSLRWAAQDRMRRFADDELVRLSKECEDEAGALRHWTPADAPTGSADGPADAGAGAGAGAGAARGAAGAERDASRRGITAGRQPSAEELLGLAAEPLSRLAERLRKPGRPGPAAADRP